MYVGGDKGCITGLASCHKCDCNVVRSIVCFAACVCVRESVCVCECVCMCVCVRMCVCVCMSVCTVPCRVSFDAPDVTCLTLSPDEEALIGREWRALQTAWRAAERRYASVLADMQQGKNVGSMNECCEIVTLRYA